MPRSSLCLSLGPGLPLVVVLATLLSACAEPPSKEMNQAQGAIDAARAAGAEQYATAELEAAVAALTQAEDAVKASDYRLALSHALDSRESAQNAAKTAVDSRAKARGDAERELAEATALLDRGEARLKEPAVARLLPRRSVAEAEKTFATARRSLQEARAALKDEEYPRVGRLAGDAAKDIQAVLADLEAALKPPAKGRRR